MNNLQAIVSAISGYNYEDIGGTNDDNYYNEKTFAGKIGYVIILSLHSDGLNPINFYEAFRIVNFLDSSYSDGEKFYNYKALAH